MLSTLVIALREGLEALLVVAFASAYFRQTAQTHLLVPLHWGIATAVTLSAALGVLLARTGALGPVWEGALATLAAVSVIACTVHMWRHGKTMQREISARLGSARQRTPWAAALTVFGLAVLMVGREGVEAATMIAALAGQSDTRHLFAGGLLGLLGAAAVAWAWTRYGRRVNLRLFFRATALFLAVFAVQLIVYAFHEFSEANALPGLDNAWWHLATEPYGPEGDIGAWLSYGLVLVPAGFLLAAWARGATRRATT